MRLRRHDANTIFRWMIFVAVIFGFLASACGRTGDLLSFESTDAGRALDAALVDGGGSGSGDGASTDGSKDGALDATNATLTSIAITPPLATIAIGTKVTLTATGTFSDGSTSDLTAAATWTSDTASVASVTGGVVSGLAAGSATIAAALNGVSGSATITVTSASIATLAITPSTASIGTSATEAFEATATLSDGSHQDVTTSVAWSSSSPSVATIAATGIATGVAGGTTTITASLAVGAAGASSLSATATLTVTGSAITALAITPTNPVLGLNVTLPFLATATYADNSVADVTANATWTSSAPTTLAIATGGTGAGIATSLAAGTSIVTAALGGIQATTTVTVTSAALQSIAVTPASTTLALGGTTALVATGTYADGSTTDLTFSVTWSSNAAGIAAVSNASGTQGTVTAISAGSATIRATLGAISGSASITVSPATLVSIAITPANPTIPIHTQLALIAKGTYSDNSIVDLTTQVTWSSSDPTVATISNATGANGTVNALALGTTTATALLGAISAQTTITVSSATLRSIAITPANPSLVVKDKELLTATGTYSDGTTGDVTSTVVWSTSSAANVTVSNASGAQGQITAVAAGSATITATLGAIAGSTTVTVTAPAIAQLVVSPALPSLDAGGNVQFTATLIFTNNTSQNVTGQATWASSNTAVATIDNHGTARAVAAGTTTITATYQAVSGTTTLTVDAAATITSITVTPIDATIAAGTRQAYAATAIYSDETSRDVTAQATWVSSATSIASISNAGGGGMGGGGGGMSGTATGLAAGMTSISATYAGVTGSTSLTVTSAVVVSISITPATDSIAVGQRVQYAASAIYSDNTSRDVTAQATWQSLDTTVAAIGTSGGGGGPMGGGNTTAGQATGIGAGTTTIEATWSGVTGSASLTVTSAAVTSIEITPASPSFPQNVPVTFHAIAIYSDDTSEDVTTQATWVSSAPAILSVGTSAGTRGVGTTIAAGTATISATWNSVTGKTTATVTAATLSSIQVTPFSPSIPVGYATAFAATGIYSDNSTYDLTSYATWTSSDDTIASVSNATSSRGSVTPLKAGSVTLNATYAAVSGTDSVTISSATLQSIAVTPASSTLTSSASEQMRATGTFSDSSTLDLTSYVTWLSSTPAIASISNASGSVGEVTGLSSGTVTISAVKGSITGTTSLTVQ